MPRPHPNSSYLINKRSAKLKAMTLRLPSDLHDAITAARQKADMLGLVFDIQGVVVDALAKALMRVESELKVLEKANDARASASSPALKDERIKDRQEND